MSLNWRGYTFRDPELFDLILDAKKSLEVSDYVADSIFAKATNINEILEQLDIIEYSLQAQIDVLSAGGVASFNSRTGVVTLTSNDVITALGFTPYNVTGNSSQYIVGDGTYAYFPTHVSSFINDVGYITSAVETDTLNSVLDRDNNTSGYDIIVTTGDRVVVGANRAGLSRGSFDNGLSADNGVSLYCSMTDPYELNFQAGILRLVQSSSGTSRLSLITESELRYSNVRDTSYNSGRTLVDKDFVDNENYKLNRLVYPLGTAPDLITLESILGFTVNNYNLVQDTFNSVDIVTFTNKDYVLPDNAFNGTDLIECTLLCVRVGNRSIKSNIALVEIKLPLCTQSTDELSFADNSILTYIYLPLMYGDLHNAKDNLFSNSNNGNLTIDVHIKQKTAHSGSVNRSVADAASNGATINYIGVGTNDGTNITYINNFATEINLGNFITTSGSYSDPSWLSSLAWSKISGAPTIPSVGTWGALNFPTWVSGTPFVKMTAAGTFALDTTTYLTSVTPHSLLSSTHGDTTANPPTRGALITGQGVTPTWSRLTIGASGTVLTSNGTDISWATPSAGTLSALLAATAANTIANLANTQTWNWNLDGTANNGMVISDIGTTGTGTLFSLSVAGSSSVKPFKVTISGTAVLDTGVATSGAANRRGIAIGGVGTTIIGGGIGTGASEAPSSVGGNVFIGGSSGAQTINIGTLGNKTINLGTAGSSTATTLGGTTLAITGNNGITFVANTTASSGANFNFTGDVSGGFGIRLQAPMTTGSLMYLEDTGGSATSTSYGIRTLIGAGGTAVGGVSSFAGYFQNAATGALNYGSMSIASNAGHGTCIGGRFEATGGVNNYALITSGGTVGFGISTPTGFVHIVNPTASLIGLIVRAASSQSANIQEWQDSSATILTRINSAGVFFPIQKATASAPTYAVGAMYFDTTLNKLRIGGASGWETVTSI